MSVTFYMGRRMPMDMLGAAVDGTCFEPAYECICGDDCHRDDTCLACRWSINLANRNASDLLWWLMSLSDDPLCGGMPAKEVAALCRRRLWPEERNVDPGFEDVITTMPGGVTLIDCGRDAGYLHGLTERLLRLAEHASDAWVCWN